MKVFIIDSNYPEDHYYDRADGAIAQQILKALGINAHVRLAFDRKHFEKGITQALRQRCNVLHISCHGNESSIALCCGRGLTWKELADLFQGDDCPPNALVMSACCGASSELGQAFQRVSKRPKIIIGSTDRRYPAEYVAAWALLYRHFCSGITRKAAQKALRDICAVVHRNFRYLRWDDDRRRYRSFPGADKQYEVSEA
jgi:hypothetical protein